MLYGGDPHIVGAALRRRISVRENTGQGISKACKADIPMQTVKEKAPDGRQPGQAQSIIQHQYFTAWQKECQDEGVQGL